MKNTEEESLHNVDKKSGPWQEHRNIVKVYRDVTRKAKVLLELNLVREVKDNNKDFFKYVSSKGKIRKNVGPLLNDMAALVM